MQSVEEKKSQYNVIRKTCYITAIIYLIFRLFYFVLFLVSKAWVVLYIDIASILIYLFSFLIIKKKKYYPYALICGNEFLVLMSICTIFLGFSTGFHLCIIGICVVSFFSVYFQKAGKRKISNAIIWTGLSITVYLIIYLVSFFNGPYYEISRWVEITLFISHTVAVFAFIAFYLMIFIRYAINLESKIINESRTDELTKLPNRYDLYNYVESISDKSNYALAMFDIDDFKKLNDKYGHIYGDQVLKQIADIAKNNSRDSFVARYGGEEFVVIIRLLGDDNEAFMIMDNIRILIENYEFISEGISTHATISVGIAKFDDYQNLESWIKNADRKLYECKNTGKNKVIM